MTVAIEPDIHQVVAAGRAYATDGGRPDLSEHLSRAVDRMHDQAYPVVVLGEFKRGKSTLINALLQRNVCPVDADVATATPTTICWSSVPGTVVHQPDGSDGSDGSAGEAEAGYLEIGLPHRLLRSGLALIDTPGTGGLDSAPGVLALSMLRSAAGTLFVTDAAQELTHPELDYLTSAAQRCPRIALVVTKIDLHREWRRIVDLNRIHLKRAGLDLPVFGVSSLLRLAACGDDEVNEESGFGALMDFLALDVVRHGQDEAVGLVACELGYVTEQLAQQAGVEQAVLDDPGSAATVVAELTEASERAAELTRSSASWQQMLNDGVQDLISDIEHDLAGRIRQLSRDVDEVIDASDPKKTWTDTEAWLRRQTALMIMDNRDQLAARTNELAADVAREFRLDAERVFAIEVTVHDEDAISGVQLAPLTEVKQPGGGKLVSYVMAGRTGYLVAMLGATLAAPLTFGLQVVVVGIASLLGTGLGGKMLLGEVGRQRTVRQQQAKTVARRYVDDVAFQLNKQTRDRLRQVHRQLRDDFSVRAEHLQSSSLQSLDAARRATDPDSAGRELRLQELEEKRQRLDQVRAAVDDLRKAA